MQSKWLSLFPIMAVLVLLTIGGPVLAANMDSKIESSAEESYVFTNNLKDDDIKVRSNAGVVTLTGNVSQESHKTLAGETVANLPKVKSVENQLEVKGEQPEAMSDAWLLTKVKTTLLYHRSVSVGTEVAVKNGIVTLNGVADNQAQKELTTEYAKDIDGVKDVNNEMTVSMSGEESQPIGAKFDDASTTALVKITLLSHRSTSALKTAVTTTDGVVVLTGKASNTAEKNLATKLAGDVSGVQSVQNDMTVM